MRGRGRMVAVVLAAGCWLAGPAGAESTQEELIQAVMRQSGLADQFAHAPEMMERQMQHRKESMPPERYEQFRQIFADAYGVPAMLATVESSLASRFDRAKFEAVLSEYRLPVLIRMAQLEVASTAADSAGQIEAFIESFREAPPAAARMELMRRMDDATQTSAVTTKMSIAVTKAFNRSLARAGLTDAPDPQELEAKVEAQATQEAELIKASVLARLLFTYREAAEEDLQAYLTFLESDLGRWFNEMAFAAVIASYEQASERAGARLAEVIMADRAVAQ